MNSTTAPATTKGTKTTKVAKALGGGLRRVLCLSAFVTFVYFFVTFVIVGTVAQEQKQQLPRFRAGASLVRVDAYPTLKGQAVTDLTAADFEV